MGPGDRHAAWRRALLVGRRAITVTVASLILFFAIACLDKVDEAAARLVTELRLGDNLPELGLMTARQRPEYQLLVARVGPAGADVLTARELRVAAAKYQDLWDASLAAAYAEFLDADEMQSLVDDRDGSEHLEKFRAMRYAVGATMQRRASGLLDRVVTEALATAHRRLEDAHPDQVLRV